MVARSAASARWGQCWPDGISQTDEARHAQQGEPTIKVLIDNGHKEYGQFLIDHMFWRSWRAFALLTGVVDGLLHAA